MSGSDLMWAVKNGDLDKVRELVEVKHLDVNESIDGRCPIHFASDYGQLEVLQYLVSRGAQLDIRDKHGIAPILAAIWEGHAPCVKFLLEKGCSKNGSTPDGQSYLEAAESSEIKSMLK
ncbi:hypothetical protein TCAL_13443 [Tigriopus californicus]|uniref:Uncharacterized protein n=1 Tax=Tigriopus californicus TaxID=6832 RepID=A0A553P8A7_TIGCA|nr:myotrophin-like [Tigriopus californicus]TRY73908.1 hypothetical protein TCAL_13443 [Tigriopus californicus]